MLREIKNMEYNIDYVRDVLTKAGYIKFSNHEITHSGIIKAYEFWQNNSIDKAFCIEIWRNDKAIIFKQSTILEI